MSKKQQGFTVIELLVATTAFSVVLLVLITSVVQIGKLYYKGLVTARTQNNARTIIDNISRPIQFSKNPVVLVPVTTPSGQPRTGAICIGTKRYTYALNAQVDDTVTDGTYDTATHRVRHALWQDDIGPGGCAAANLTLTVPSVGGKELLNVGSRLTKFEVTNVSGMTNLWTVNIGVLYGDDDLIRFNDGATENDPAGCLSGIQGSQWCALSELNTQVNERLVQ